MGVAHLLASDFPTENPRTQTRNFPYTKTVMRQRRGGEKTKKPELEDLQKAGSPMARELLDQYKIILLNSY